MMNEVQLVTMIGVAGLMIERIFTAFRSSRCTKIKTCCCEIERDLVDEKPQDPNQIKTPQNNAELEIV